MDIPTPAPQVVVRGEAMLVVDPEIAAKARGAVERMISIGQSGSGE